MITERKHTTKRIIKESKSFPFSHSAVLGVHLAEQTHSNANSIAEQLILCGKCVGNSGKDCGRNKISIDRKGQV